MRKFKYIVISRDSGERLELENAPDGWNEQKVNIVWDLTYFGLLKTLSVEFEFVGDGYEFVRRMYLTYGVDADLLFRIYDYATNKFRYEGKVNYEEFVDDRKHRRFKIDLLQSSLVQDFKNRESIKLNVLNDIGLDRQAVTPAAPVIGKIRGKEIEFYSNFGKFEGEDALPDEQYHHLVPFRVIENGNPEVEYVSNFELTSDVPSLYNVENAILQNNQAGITQQVRVKGNYSYQIKNIQDAVHFIDPYKYHIRTALWKFAADNTPIDTYFNTDTVMGYATPNIVNVSKDFDLVVTLLDGQYLVWITHLYINDSTGAKFMGTPNYYDPGTPALDLDLNLSPFRIEYTNLELEFFQNSIFPDSEAPVIYPFEFFNSLVEQMTGKSNALVSNLFGRTSLGYAETGEGALTCITKGDWLRGIPVEETELATSFKDTFKSFDAIYNIGLKIVDDVIHIEKKEDLRSNEVILELGNVSDLEISASKEFLFNSVIAGFPDAEYEQENGRDEFNTEAQYTNSIRSVKKELNIQSVFRGDGYGIEFARRAAIETTGSKDTRYDKVIFLIDMYDDEIEGLISRRLEGIDFVAGVFSPDTVMNARISTGQNLLRWEGYLSIPLHRKPKEYYYQANLKNSSLAVGTSLGNTEFGEDIVLSENAYFLPEKHKFNNALTLSNLLTLLQNPLGLISYIYRGEKFFDYLFEVDSEAEGGTSQWNTLATKASPINRTEEILGNTVKYNGGFEDNIAYGDSEEDTILYN